MLSSATRIFASLWTGLAATLIAMGLAVALGATVSSAQREQARLQGQVEGLRKELTLAVSVQRAQAASCAQDAKALVVAAADPKTRLLLPPPGFDVCARMENADQAVLDSLG